VVLLAFNLRTAVASIPPVLPDLGLAHGVQAVLTSMPLALFGAVALSAPTLRERFGEDRCLLAALATLLARLVLRAAWPGWALFPGTALACGAIAVVNVLVPGHVRRRFPARVGAMTGLCAAALTLGAASAAGLTVPLRDLAGSTRVALALWAL